MTRTSYKKVEGRGRVLPLVIEVNAVSLPGSTRSSVDGRDRKSVV